MESIFGPERILLMRRFVPRTSSSSFSAWMLIFPTLASFKVSVTAFKDFSRFSAISWKLVFSSLIRYPHKFALAITLAIYGFHFRRVIETI